MTSEDYVRRHAPDVYVRVKNGRFVGGSQRFEILLGKQIIGYGIRQREAWAEAARWLKRNRSDAK